MDPLSRLHSAAGGLLTMVDATLTRIGAREDHPIWPLLRLTGRLPGDAVAYAAAFHPADLTARVELLARHRETEANISTALATPTDWEGEAGTSFHNRLALTQRDLTHLDETGHLLSGWFADLASYLLHGRLRLAHTLGRVLRSAEAVTLKAGAPPGEVQPATQAEAAATVGTTLLAEVDVFWQGSLAISHHWATRLESTSALIPTPALLSHTSTTTLRTDL